MKPITGNTYVVKEQLKALGGRWNPDRKLWEIPDDKWEEAERIVKAAPVDRKPLFWTDIIAIAVRKRGGTPGVCSECGAKCKYPYDECWDCHEEREMGY
jgi:hypothetical protein